MNFRGIKLPIVGLVALATLVVFLGGQMAMGYFTVDQPMAKALQGRPGVVKYEIDKQSQPLVIRVQLAPNADLKSVYDGLTRDLSNIMSKKDFKLEVMDNRDQVLDQALYTMHYAIEEGLTRGNFTEMSSNIQQNVRAENLDSYSLWVDEQHVYLQLRHGDHALFQIYDRDANNQTAKI